LKKKYSTPFKTDWQAFLNINMTISAFKIGTNPKEEKHRTTRKNQRVDAVMLEWNFLKNPFQSQVSVTTVHNYLPQGATDKWALVLPQWVCLLTS
jgi:hypothetical protein